MQRILLSVAVLLLLCPLAMAQDDAVDLSGVERGLRDIAWELSLLNINQPTQAYERLYGRSGGYGGLGAGGFDPGVPIGGKWVPYSYFAPGAHEKRVKQASRVKRAQEHKAQQAARRVKGS